MYVINMKITKVYSMGEYVFNSKNKVNEFLNGLTDYEIESIISIEKYNKHSFRSAWNDFFAA